MIEYVLFIVGIIFLIKGADYLIDGSSSLAKKLKVSPLVIGLTIVAFGTSMPELIVSLIAALKGSSGVIFGNIIGSNIANILLVLGVAAIISPLKVKSNTIWKELPFALLAAVVLFIFSNYFLIDGVEIGYLTRVSGLVMLCFFLIFIFYTVGLAKKEKDVLSKEVVMVKHNNLMIFFLIFVGLVGLYFGGKWVVNGAVFAAQQFGLSEFLISSTIIAVGTSLPELVTAINASRKKESDILVGNSIGSNIFNIFWILGFVSLLAPVLIPGSINGDLLFLVLVSLLIFISLFIGKKHELERWQGWFFVLLYVGYIVSLIIRG